jgi:dTDP-4-dehydrorhamnose 3,5-epimerase
MKLVPIAIEGVVIVEPTVSGDERGWFMETFNEPRFHRERAALGLPAPRPIVRDKQTNSSRTHRASACA